MDRTRLAFACCLAALAGVGVLHAAPPKDGGKNAKPPPQKDAAEDNAGGGLEIDIGLGDNTTAIEVTTPSKQAFDRAQDLMAKDDWGAAAVAFHGVLKDPKAKEYHEQSEYLLAKALYRMGLYHSSLAQFVAVLQKGEKHKYYKTSKEWLFFISRKAADQGVVVEEIARYAVGDLPEKYADEFHFLLGKLYFQKATADEGVEAKPAGEGGEDLQFDTDDAGGGAGDAPGPRAGSGGDDGLDFGLDDLEEAKPKEKDKGKGKDKNGKAQKGKKEEPPPAPAPAPKKEEEALEFGGIGDKVEEEEKPAPAPAPKKKEAAPVEEPPPPQRALVADVKDALQKCVEHAAQVKPESNLRLRAVYLGAVCNYELQEFEKAVVGFREVVKLTKAGKWKNHPLREEAFFSLARTHYAFRQFRAAIFYYNRISRDSGGWLDALFESSWAYFRLADYEKALGNLVTIHAPFFVNEYFPESLILKAVTYYENCRYPEALGVLDEFEGQYGPLRDELDKLTKDAKTPEDYYALLKKLEGSRNATALTQRLVKLARGDKNLALKAASARELEAEEQKIQKAQALQNAPLQKELLDLVKKHREATVTEAGKIARAKLETERDELKSLSSQLFRIKFEIIKREKEGLEASLRGEKQGTKLGAYRYSTAVEDTELYWPFDGEYWRDELGTYEYTLSKGCRQ
ncbi:MAG: hypothetical protein HY904_04555 [Deltaproteobacteria bacterium]|nr:hypothetical protein [Deltaproteobacteria bacterium]